MKYNHECFNLVPYVALVLYTQNSDTAKILFVN